jgi:Fe2+ or Zn2+ uptake regulation protein
MEKSLTLQAELILRNQGGRMTAQRKLILEKLGSMSGHPTAEELFDAVCLEDESLHLSTVYRTLRWLEEQNLVTPRWFEDERRQERFDTQQDEPNDHYHFKCQNCEKIIEFSDAQVEGIKQSFSLLNGAEVRQASLVLYGICRECSRL